MLALCLPLPGSCLSSRDVSQLQGKAGVLQIARHSLVRAEIAEIALISCSYRSCQRSHLTWCFKSNHWNELSLKTSNYTWDKLPMFEQAEDKVCWRRERIFDCGSSAFFWSFTWITNISAYGERISETSSFLNTWEGYWLGPDIEDGWGYVKAVVSQNYC